MKVNVNLFESLHWQDCFVIVSKQFMTDAVAKQLWQSWWQ
jgi:hypothetical protein